MEKPWLKHYDLGVPESYDYPLVPLNYMLEETTRRNPYKTAMIYNDNTITYQELNRMADSFAASLLKLGIKKGDRVMLSLPNVPATVIAYYGVLKMGGIIVNSNPLYSENELEAMLNDSGAVAVVTFDMVYPKFAALMPNTSLEKIIVAPFADFVPPSPEVFLFRDLISGKEKPPAITVDPKEDVALLQYTGGTTGTPKGVMLTHFNLIANATQIAGFARTTADDIFFSAIPFFHVYGMTTSMNIPIMMGATSYPFPSPGISKG